MAKSKKAKIERQPAYKEEMFNVDDQFENSFPQERTPTLPVQGSFRDEIKAMLYVYGDVRYPLSESVSLVEDIVFTQMCDLLVKAAGISTMRSSEEIGVEEFTYLLRHDPGKLNRFVVRMKFLDTHGKIISKGDQDDEDSSFNFQDRNSLKRYKRILGLLHHIDDSGELVAVAMKSSIDDTKRMRMERAEKQTRDMSTKEYMEFVKLRRIGFTTKRIPHHSQRKQLCDWFDLEKLQIPVPVSEFGWDAMEYLAQETVAELVDKALLVRSETTSSLLHCEIEPDARHLPLYSSSTLVGRAETLGDATQSSDDNTASGKVVEGPLNRKLALTPSDIREAMRRFLFDSQRMFLSDLHFSISRKLLCID